MGVTALVMAGGRGTRMRLAEEKPLVKVRGKPVIEYVIAALKNAKKHRFHSSCCNCLYTKHSKLFASFPS